MSFDCDVDDADLDETEYVNESRDEEYSADQADEFEEIDFEALGIKPTSPTNAKPGTSEKVLMMAARYAAGVALWHSSECLDHGPGQSIAKLLRKG